MLPVAATSAGIVSFAFGTIALGSSCCSSRTGSRSTSLFIPVIAAVQFVFTLACAFLVAAGNVFFRDLGNVVGHLLRLWWFLSPGLYSLATLDQVAHLQGHTRALMTLAGLNPFAILFEAYRMVIYGTPDRATPGRRTSRRWRSCSWPARSSWR